MVIQAHQWVNLDMWLELYQEAVKFRALLNQKLNQGDPKAQEINNTMKDLFIVLSNKSMIISKKINFL